MRFNFYVKLVYDKRKTPSMKNIESLDLTRKVNLLSLWRGKDMISLSMIPFKTQKV